VVLVSLSSAETVQRLILVTGKLTLLPELLHLVGIIKPRSYIRVILVRQGWRKSSEVILACWHLQVFRDSCVVVRLHGVASLF
jgi:hypothetical protein